MKWNAVGWIEEVQDILLKARFSHDAKGNRRSILASVFWEGSWKVDIYQSWNTYDAADKMLIVNGVLTDGTIHIAPGHGTKLIYDVTTQRREHEITISPEGQNINTTLAYFDNNLLEHTSSTNYIYRRWAYDGDTPLRSEFITRAGTNTTTRASQYNLNAWLTHDDSVNGKQKLATGYTLNAIGLPDSQSTTLTLDGKKEYEEELSFAYVAFDTDKIATVAGYLQRTEGGRTKSETNSYYDPNGSTELITSSKEAIRRFITNSAGLILQKTQGADKKEYYLFTTSGQFLGCFGNSPPEGLNVPLPHIELNLNFQPVSEHFPAPTPDTYVVQLNDSFASIAERVLKDARFAAEIADVNAYARDDIPPPGLVLQIPSLVNTNVHNFEGIYPSYNPAAIMGSTYPHMKIPHRHNTHAKRANFWHIVLEAAIGTAIIAFAPQIAGLFTGMFSQFVGELLGFALAGAASSITQQELAIGLGDQTEAFSLNAVGQSALLTMATMGASKALKLDVLRASPHSLTLIETVKNIELTIATQAVSFATGQQRHFDWRIFAASVASTVANLGAGQINSKVPLFNDALATASASVASIGTYQLLGVNISNEAIVANALGTVIGNQVAAQAKAHFEQYQNKKQQQRTQIPEIYAQLAESERDFIQSVLEHPHDFGKTAASEKANTAATSNKHAPHATKTYNKPTEKLPPQEHLMVTRAEKEERMSRAARWNEEQSAARTQPRPSEGGFWSSAIERAANSNLVTSINNIGDKVAYTTLSIVDEIVNPITQFKHTMADANEATQAMKSGELGHAVVATGKTALDELALIPFASAVGKGVGYLTKLGANVSFFGGGAATVGKGIKNGSALNTAPFEIHPRVNSQLSDSRLGELAGKITPEEIVDLANNRAGKAFLDTKSGHINYIQELEGKLFRITTSKDEFKIISVGPIRERNLVNSVRNGRFKPIDTNHDLNWPRPSM